MKKDKGRHNAGKSLFKQTFFALAKSTDTPFSLAKWLCLKYNDHQAFLGLEINPKDYGDSTMCRFLGKASSSFSLFARDLAVSEFASKFKGFDLGLDTREQALLAFKTSEASCQTVNERLRPLLLKSSRFEAIILMAQRKIGEVLGSSSSVFDKSSGWGPGSTFSIKGDVGWDLKILEKRISVTSDLLPLAQVLIGADLHWCRARGLDSDGPCTLLSTEFQIVPGNRISTVQKNAKTDRTIAIEPTANVYFQKFLGTHIRRRLKKCCRIDLDDQTANQKAARFLENATIDLKAASDSISEYVVRLLFPERWITLLSLSRSSNYYLDGHWTRYHKWSSMGNGYTFELETLIFYALAWATQLISNSGNSNPWLKVYGDDIIVPAPYAQATIEVLKFFGFETNQKKTHYLSLYRESCGLHYFDGFEVTPIYQKEIPTDVEEIYHMANRIRHLASRLGGYYYSDIIYQRCWLSVIKYLKDTNELRVIPFSPSYPSFDKPDGYDPAISGAVQCSIEDMITLEKPILTYGSKHSVRRFTASKRKADHAAGLALSLSTSKPVNRSRGVIDSELNRISQSLPSLDGDVTIDLRGRGRWSTRKVRVFRSYTSNAWL